MDDGTAGSGARSQTGPRRSARAAVAGREPAAGALAGAGGSGDPVRSSMLGDQVKDQLLRRILLGEYPPGARIVETRVARDLGVSQGPVREALRDLATLGLVELQPYRGARVRRPETEEIREAMRVRARRMYLRARNYGLRGLEVRHKGFEKALRADPKQAVSVTTVKDVALLYWTAVSWAGAVSLSKDNPDLIADMPIVEAMMDRALALDEAFGDGAIHSYLITYEMSRPGGVGDPAARSRQHYERAMALSGGQLAGPMVSYAEAVCVQQQDLKQFEALLQQALAINPDAKPETRLVNLIMQRRAKWLLERTDQLFLNPAGAKAKSE